MDIPPFISDMNKVHLKKELEEAGRRKVEAPVINVVKSPNKSLS